MPTRQEQKEERRNAILEAGLELFVQKGYSGTKISDIAKKAGMSTGLMFHYFESKEQLYIELVKIGLGGTKKALEFDEDHPLEFFRQAAEMILYGLTISPFISKMFVLMARSSDGDVPDSVREIVSQVNNIESTVPLIEAGQRLGEIREGDPFSLSFAFWSSIQGVAETYDQYPDVACPDAEWIVDIIRKRD